MVLRHEHADRAVCKNWVDIVSLPDGRTTTVLAEGLKSVLGESVVALPSDGHHLFLLGDGVLQVYDIRGKPELVAGKDVPTDGREFRWFTRPIQVQYVNGRIVALSRVLNTPRWGKETRNRLLVTIAEENGRLLRSLLIKVDQDRVSEYPKAIQVVNGTEVVINGQPGKWGLEVETGKLTDIAGRAAD
jgi:hypothetical protein